MVPPAHPRQLQHHKILAPQVHWHGEEAHRGMSDCTHLQSSHEEYCKFLTEDPRLDHHKELLHWTILVSRC
jgi:hypothetical protein